MEKSETQFYLVGCETDKHVDNIAANTSRTEKLGHYARTLSTSEFQKLQEAAKVSEFKQNKLEEEAKKNWDLFYKRNGIKFFKDRHWPKQEFELLCKEIERDTNAQSEKPVLLEIGCGVGNFVFPLIEEKTNFFINACDFSPRAIQFVKEHALYNSSVCHAFVCDVTKDDLSFILSPSSVNVATLIYVLSAIHPDKMLSVFHNIYKVLKPNGFLLFRDYGLYDQAMLRFNSRQKLGENFYVRQDGTRCFYFSEDYLSFLARTAGFKILECCYVTRQTTNIKEEICIPRVFIQGKFLKPGDGT